MDFAELYHFFFETMPGTGCLVLACLIITTIVAAVLEVKTRRAFKDRGERTDDVWDFDDEEEEE